MTKPLSVRHDWPMAAHDIAWQAILPELAAPPSGSQTRMARRRRAIWAAVVPLGALILMAGLMPITGAVVSLGEVTTTDHIKRLAHPDGGVIARVWVKNGDHVAQGQVLISLDDRVAGADARASGQSLAQLLADKARLEAEQAGDTAIAFPPELQNAGNGSPIPPSDARAAMDAARRLFATRAGELADLVSQIGARIAQYREEIAGYAVQIAALQQQRQLIEPERRNVRDLWNRQLVTISRLNELERTAVSLDGQIGALRAQIAGARARIGEAQVQAIQLVQSRRAEAGASLAQLATQLAQQQSHATGAATQQDRTTIRAPGPGTIEKLAFSSPGEVVRPAEPVAELVPDTALGTGGLVVEAFVRPADIDAVHAGQRARIHFDSADRNTTPDIPGLVLAVATTRSENTATGAAFYSVRIAIDEAAISREHLALRSGQPASVFITTGDRSLLSYLTRPLRDQFARALRDH